MIFDIAIGIVCGFLLLAAVVVFIGCLFIVISKQVTLRKTSTMKRYDFEEEDNDEFDEYK